MEKKAQVQVNTHSNSRGAIFSLQFTKELHQNEKHIPEAVSLEAIIRPHRTILQIIALKKKENKKRPF